MFRTDGPPEALAPWLATTRGLGTRSGSRAKAGNGDSPEGPGGPVSWDRGPHRATPECSKRGQEKGGARDGVGERKKWRRGGNGKKAT
eukprot:10667569-Alexandrium_andersonii.AAC.1